MGCFCYGNEYNVCKRISIASLLALLSGTGIVHGVRRSFFTEVKRLPWWYATNAGVAASGLIFVHSVTWLLYQYKRYLIWQNAQTKVPDNDSVQKDELKYPSQTEAFPEKSHEQKDLEDQRQTDAPEKDESSEDELSPAFSLGLLPKPWELYAMID